MVMFGFFYDVAEAELKKLEVPACGRQAREEIRKA
jgi:hypothetical protein